MFGRFREDVRLVADVGHDRHHELFADRINRWIRHLCKKLVEVVEQAEVPVRPQARKRGVVAHRADGFVSGLGHWPENQFNIFQRPAEAFALAGHSPAISTRRHDFVEEARDGNVVFFHPAAIGLSASVVGLDFGILHEAVIHEIKPEDGAGFEAAVSCDVLGRNVEDTGFGSEDEEPVFRERPAGGAKSVAVKCGAEADAVRKRDGGGAVPRFHQRGMVFIERAYVVSHVVFRAPRLRDEHHHCVRRVASGGDEQLEHVVERGRIALSLVDERQNLLDVDLVGRRPSLLLYACCLYGWGWPVKQNLLLYACCLYGTVGERERRLACGERVEIPLERVDFPVVRNRAKRMRQFPRRERIGRIPLVDDGERRDEFGIGEVRIELLDLRGKQKPLVNDRARRAGADIGLRRGLLDLPPDDIEPTLEAFIIFATKITKVTKFFFQLCVLCDLCGYK